MKVRFLRSLGVMTLRFVYSFLRVFWFVTKPITVGVRVMMVQQDRVILVHHSYQNAWFLPGGAVQRGETLEQAARREAREETGARLLEVQFLGTYSSFIEGKSDHVSLFLCEDFIPKDSAAIGSANQSADFEISEVCAFTIDHLPDSLAPGHGDRINEYRNGFFKSGGPSHGLW